MAGLSQSRNANHAHSAACLAPSSSRPWLLLLYALFICASLALILTLGTPQSAEETRSLSSARSGTVSVFSTPPQLDMQDASVWHTYVNLASKYVKPSHYKHIVADAPTLAQQQQPQTETASPIAGAAIGGDWLSALRATTFDTASWNSTSTSTAPSCATWASDWLTARFNTAGSTSSDPAVVRRMLKNLMVSDFPPALRRLAPFLAGPVPLSGVLSTVSSCSMSNQPIIAFLCEWHSAVPGMFDVSSATGSPFAGASLVELLTFMSLVDRLATAARDDHVFAADLLFHVSSRFAESGGTDRFFSDDLPYKAAGLAEFVRDKFEAVQLAQITKNMARIGVGRLYGSFGAVPWSPATPSISKAHLLQLNLLEAAYEQVDSLPANAQTGLALAWNLQRRHILSEVMLHEAGNHDQRMALTKDWVDSYISWNGIFVLEKFQYLPAMSILFLPSIICVNDESINVPGFSSTSPATEEIASGNWIILRGYSLYLMLVYASTPQTADMYLRNDGNLTNAVNSWSTQTLLNSHFDVPTASDLKEMAAWFPSPLSPFVHLSPLGRRMLLTFAVFGSVALAAMCLEYATAYHLLNWTSGGRKQHGAALTGWLLAEGMFPLALCISVYSRAWWAPLLLVIGLWKLGFPEITSALINSVPHSAPAPATTSSNPNHECSCKLVSMPSTTLSDDSTNTAKALPVVPSPSVEKDSSTAIHLTQVHPPMIYVLLCAMQFLDGWGTLLHHLSVSCINLASCSVLWKWVSKSGSRWKYSPICSSAYITMNSAVFGRMLFAHWCLWAAGLAPYFIEQYYRFSEFRSKEREALNPSTNHSNTTTDLKPIPTLACRGQSTTNLKLTPNDDHDVNDETVITILPFDPARDSVVITAVTPDDRSSSPPDGATSNTKTAVGTAAAVSAAEVSSLITTMSQQEQQGCTCAKPVHSMDVDTRPSKIWHFRQAARRLHFMSPHTMVCDDDEDPKVARQASNSLHND